MGGAFGGTRCRRSAGPFPWAVPAQPGRRRVPGRQLAGTSPARFRGASRPVRAHRVGGAADPGLDRLVDGVARADRRPDRGHRAGSRPRTDGDRGFDDGAALQAGPRGRRPRPRTPRDRPGHRQLPDRPLRARRHRRRTRLRAELDRDRPWGGSHVRAGGGGSGAEHGARAAEPRRLPVRMDRERRDDHEHRARRRGTGAVGPEPLGGLGRARAGRVGRRPGCGLHVQVPQRRTRLPRVRLRPARSAGRPVPTDPGLDGTARSVRDGPRLRARARGPGRRERHPADPGRRSAERGARHVGGGDDRGGPGQVGAAHRLRPRTDRRLVGTARGAARVAPRPRAPRRAPDDPPPRIPRCARRALGAGRDPGLPGAGRDPDRVGAAVDRLRGDPQGLAVLREILERG